MSAHFITGTGTDIGKTWLVCALLRQWRAQGLKPRAYKPVQSGFDITAPEASDAGLVLTALGHQINTAALDAIAPWRFAAPLSPDMAAAMEGRSIAFDDLVAFTRRIPQDVQHTLVEGVGGVMVPLDGRHTVRDWIAASGLPAVLVTGSYLGSLSHTLTAVIALQQLGVVIRAIVLNESAESKVALEATMATIASHTKTIPLIALRRACPDNGIAQLASALL